MAVRANPWHVLAAVMAGSLPTVMDASMLTVSIPNIAAEFQTGIGTVQWVPSLYRLIIVSLLLVFGRLGDMVGHHRVYQWGLLSFSIGSILCGLSQNIGMLIAFRIPQGIAASMTMSMANALITQSFGPGKSGRAFGLYFGSVGAANAIGPIFGGVLTQYLGWRFIFAVDVIIAFGSFLVARRVLRAEGAHRRSQPQSFDRVGGATLLFCLLSLLLLINRVPSWGWTAAPSLALAAVAVFSGAAFFRTELRVPQPLLSMRLFSILPFSLGTVAALLVFMAINILNFLAPFYVQMVLHLSPSVAGFTMAAQPVMLLIFPPLFGSLSDRIGARPLTFLGPVISCLALLFMLQLGPQNTAFDAAWRLALFAVGVAAFQSPNTSAIMDNVPRSEVGIVSAMINFSRNMGWLLGTVVGAAMVSASLPTYQALQQETDLLVSSLRSAYLLGALLSGLAALAPLVPRRSQPAR